MHHSSSDRAVAIGQGEERHREDAILVGEAPVLFQPAVECLQDRDRGFDVGLHRALHAHALRREQPRRLYALLVHAPEAGVAVEPLRMLGRGLACQLVADAGLVALPGKVVVQRAGARAEVDVAGAGDDRVETAAHDVAGHPVDIDHAHAALRELRVAVAGEGVGRLPVVIVGVEDRGDRVVGARHASSFSRCRAGAVGRVSRWCTRRRRTSSGR